MSNTVPTLPTPKPFVTSSTLRTFTFYLNGDFYMVTASGSLSARNMLARQHQHINFAAAYITKVA